MTFGCVPLKWDETITLGNPAVFLGLVRGIDGEPIQQADITSITYIVYDRLGANVASGTVVVATSIFDTLQTEADDPRWDEDDTGYNFAATVAGTAFPTVNSVYNIRFTLTPVTGGAYRIGGKITTEP